MATVIFSYLAAMLTVSTGQGSQITQQGMQICSQVFTQDSVDSDCSASCELSQLDLDNLETKCNILYERASVSHLISGRFQFLS